ncbi:response regulator [Aeromicrobium sp. CF3.5]|uniref:response regulator n=1 Tax=Aeromicrobium sp. CF3.5 TaxID=3373078 RepID=UPI003EE58314
MTSIRTLVVDDDPAAGRLHAGYVETEPGFSLIATVDSGRAALNVVEHAPVDLVLLDINLPGISGIEVLHRLRRAGVRPVDVIVISSSRDRVTVRQALSAQVADYLVKPFSREAFSQRLRAYGEARSVTRAVNEDRFGQQEIDSMMRGGAVAARTPPGPRVAADAVVQGLPKGLSVPTMELVLQVLREQGSATAREIGEGAGTSRATARRYLEHLNERGTVDVSHRYGGQGRPELLYRLAPPTT